MKNIKTEKELTDDIMTLTTTIRELFPELSKYIEEMPLTVSNAYDSDVTIKNLFEYYNSLDTLLKKYGSNHGHPAKSNLL